MSYSRTRGSAWSTAAVIVGVVAAGTVVAGLLHEPPSGAVVIPGCEEVVQPEDMTRVNFAFVAGDAPHDADAPWTSDAKAQAMTDALVAALPNGTAIEPDPFAPALVFEAFTGVPDGTSLGSTARAYGTVTVGDRTGILTVDVGLEHGPVGPCFAGRVDKRSTIDDGTVLDIVDRIDSRRVIAHTPDGTRIEVSARGVMTLEQVINIALTQGLRASAPI